MFDEVRFPEDISYGAIGGPEYLTKIIPLNSGNEYRNITNSLSKLKYNISYVVKTNEQISKLLTFFIKGYNHKVKIKMKMITID